MIKKFKNIKTYSNRKAILCLIVLINGFAFINTAKSQQMLKLEDAISIGLKANYDIQLSKSETLISKANNTAGNAGMIPNINLNAGANYSMNNSHIEYSSGIITDNPSASLKNYNAGITLNWTVFDGLKMFITKSKLEEIEKSGEIRFRNQLQQSIAKIIDAYYEIVKQKQYLNAIREIKALSNERKTIGETRFNAGLSAKTELLQAQIDFNTQSQNEIQQLNVIEQSKINLNTIINRELYNDFDVSDSINFTLIDSTYAESKILSSNQNIQLLYKQIEVSRLTIKEFESLILPYINLVAGYGLTSAENSTGLTNLNRNYGPNIGLNLSYPIYQAGNISRQIQVAEISSNNLEIQLDAAKKSAKSQFLNLYSTFRTNLKMLDIENATKNLAKENLFLAMERLKLSQATSIEVRDAQLSYENSLTRLTNINFNLKLAETHLKLLMGELK